LVEIVTWNDWFESSYIAAPLSGGASSVSSFAHQAYLELGKHYIAWYKTGAKPVPANDEIYLFYYTHGSSISISAPPCGVLSDTLYVVVVMKPGPTATITLNSGSASNTISTGSQTQGVYVTGMGFQTDTQSATYTQGSVTYTLTGEMPISNSGLSTYNFNVYSIFCANVQNGSCGIPENQNS
jgi:glucan endo-1,3-alpha-glucosidase